MLLLSEESVDLLSEDNYYALSQHLDSSTFFFFHLYSMSSFLSLPLSVFSQASSSSLSEILMSVFFGLPLLHLQSLLSLFHRSGAFSLDGIQHFSLISFFSSCSISSIFTALVFTSLYFLLFLLFASLILVSASRLYLSTSS